MKSLKNKTNETIYILGVEHLPDEWVAIPKNLEIKYAMNETVLTLLLSGSIVASADNSKELIKTTAINFLMNSSIIDSDGYAITKSLPFSAKTIEGKKLFKRIHGMNQDCIVGENLFEFIVPYNQCKITGIEMINGEPCDYVNLEVYDSDQGLVSGTPNLKLNQFGFNVSISKDYYEHKSEYDADLFIGLKILVRYNSQTARKIGINIILNEVK